MIKKQSTRDILRKNIDRAMPEVKKVVKEFGRSAVSACLKSLYELDREMKKLADLEKEVAKIKSKIK